MTSTDIDESHDIQSHNDRLLALGPLDPAEFPLTDIPPPLDDSAKCKLTLIRTGTGDIPQPLFIHGTAPDTTFKVPAFAFLIEKTHKDRVERVLFELGLRETSKHTVPRYIMLGKLWNFQGNVGVAEILKTNGVALESISGLVLGHAHVDHIGNLADFPRTVSMLVGPGSPVGDDLAVEMDVPTDDIKSRKIHQLDRQNDRWQTIGTFQGYDYFGDGSFWVLDVPGHKPGHLAGMVRTSTNPPVYYILGSDTAHFPYLISQVQPSKVALWPESALDPSGSADKLSSMHHDLDEAYKSMAKMQRMNQENNVQVILAHDRSIDLVLPEGDFIPLEGTLDEVNKFKGRDQTRE